ncbi:hypothetical protein TRFO_00810 [Tritrichomonas foetus]|uniref:Uncharacterized protein n=1 Tax=Tritrichomonas foetus TaxID=1144522 RepID=A0A1J4L230_9EUKA|nr:hypothetical protein TRFO_00810 [Tritrichomonas foetus]|eukprot:OHT17569.1 hypothetical protein TRFO_00810 [Tritrichomonas foetus]
MTRNLKENQILERQHNNISKPKISHSSNDIQPLHDFDENRNKHDNKIKNIHRVVIRNSSKPITADEILKSALKIQEKNAKKQKTKSTPGNPSINDQDVFKEKPKIKIMTPGTKPTNETVKTIHKCQITPKQNCLKNGRPKLNANSADTTKKISKTKKTPTKRNPKKSPSSKNIIERGTFPINPENFVNDILNEDNKSQAFIRWSEEHQMATTPLPIMEILPPPCRAEDPTQLIECVLPDKYENEFIPLAFLQILFPEAVKNNIIEKCDD